MEFCRHCKCDRAGACMSRPDMRARAARGDWQCLAALMRAIRGNYDIDAETPTEGGGHGNHH